MAKLKFTNVPSTIADAVSTAYGELESLATECREIVDNASEGLSATARIETLGATADELEQQSEPDVPEGVGAEAVTYQTWTNARKGRGLSRADRCGFACSVLETVIDILDNETDKPEVDAEADDTADDAGDEADDGDRDGLKDSLQETLDAVQGLEFPGMYG